MVLPEETPVQARISTVQRSVSGASGETSLELPLHDHEGIEAGFHLNVLQNHERAAPDAAPPRGTETS